MPVALLGLTLLALLGAAASVATGVALALRQGRQGGGGHRTGRWLEEGALGGARGVSPELLAQVRKLHIRTRQQVDELMSGEYSSAFKGRGMEFEEVREYIPGDDVRAIDWNVTARMQRPFVKEFREERELVVMIAVDVSPSGDFGTAGKLKSELTAELAATLAFAASRNNDKVGLLLFSDRVERFIPPQKGRGHVWRIIRELLTHERRGAGTDLSEALGFLNRVVRKKAVVFLLSDFLDEQAWERPLRIANRRHDLVAFRVSDPREQSLPDVGLIAVEDAEDGRRAWVDSADGAVRKAWQTEAARRQARLRAELRRLDVDLVELSTAEGVARPLMRYFRTRERRMR